MLKMPQFSSFGIILLFAAMVTFPIWMTMLVLNLPIIIMGFVLYRYTNIFNSLWKFGVRLQFDLFTWFYRKSDMVFLNAGYADVDVEDGIFDKLIRDKFDNYRIQLYHFIVMNLGGVRTMHGKSLLETGCGRGGGLRYIAKELRPSYAVGVDISQ